MRRVAPERSEGTLGSPRFTRSVENSSRTKVGKRTLMRDAFMKNAIYARVYESRRKKRKKKKRKEKEIEVRNGRFTPVGTKGSFGNKYRRQGKVSVPCCSPSAIFSFSSSSSSSSTSSSSSSFCLRRFNFKPYFNFKYSRVRGTVLKLKRRARARTGELLIKAPTCAYYSAPAFNSETTAATNI